MSTKHWFRPESPDVLAMLREQAAITVEAMDGLVAWAGGDHSAVEVVRSCEHRADDQKRELWRALRDAFSTPIDAEDLYSLSADLDEVLNAAKNLVRESDVMGLDPDEPTHSMAVYLRDAVGHLAEAFARLEDHNNDATVAADAAIKSQRHLERAYRPAMSALINVDDLHAVVARREIYRRLSRIGDLIHAVADRVWYAMVKEA